jgi:hypothetical protein
LLFREVTNMMEFKITRLDTGGFVVKDAFFDNVFASTRIDGASGYIQATGVANGVTGSVTFSWSWANSVASVQAVAVYR